MDELMIRLVALEGQRDFLMQILALMGVSGIFGAIAFGVAVYRAAMSHTKGLIESIGGDLLAVASREREREAGLNRQILVVSESQDLALWGFLRPHLRNLKVVAYDDVAGSDLSGSIVVAVPTRLPGEGDLTLSMDRMSSFMAGCTGLSFPQLVLSTGRMPGNWFNIFAAEGVLTSQSKGRLLGDVLSLLARGI